MLSPHKAITGLALASMFLSACSGQVYVRDGVTDGDTFFLAPAAMGSADPALQSWVRYSLMRSACQLELGGPNPARAGSFDCEYKARKHLIGAWREQREEHPGAADAYLDDLLRVDAAQFLPEYVAYYHHQRDWEIPAGLDPDGFRAWRRKSIPGHRLQTRLTGSWGYSVQTRP